MNTPRDTLQPNKKPKNKNKKEKKDSPFLDTTTDKARKAIENFLLETNFPKQDPRLLERFRMWLDDKE
jgi:hypothetical protein